MEKFLLFGKYSTDVTINDLGLVKYINLDERLVLHTHGRHARRHMGKGDVNVVERLINNMMRTEKYTGKKMSAYRAVKKAFEIIEKKTKKNPLQIFVNAIVNAAPREEVTRLKMAGIAVPKAVDVAPLRRVDIALRNIALGAVRASFRNTRSIEECLADEIIKASKNDVSSYAVSKKDEVERVASSAR